MTSTYIARHRLISQQLEGTDHKTVKEMVSWLGAVQAQHYEMAKWAIGIRLSTTAAAIEKAINRGEILRTHVLRPTWHFVSSADIRWMCMLTAPRIKASLNSNWRKMELDDKLFARTHRIFEQVLCGKKCLSREELVHHLKNKGIDPGNPMRSAHIMLRAELDGILCNGPKKDKVFTYTLLEEKIGKSKTLEQEEAAAELAWRYFSSHGCATFQDFCWWSGLGIRDAKIGLELVKKKLDSVLIDNKTYWFRHSPDAEKNFDRIHLLPAFDEFLISYKDRSASLTPGMTRRAVTTNGIFKPLIVLDGKVTGTWKMSPVKDRLLIQPFKRGSGNILKKQPLEEAVNRYAHFLGSKLSF